MPDGAIVLFSGIGPDAQTQLDVGIGALAGSTVMLITIPWFLAIYGGRVNLGPDGQPKYSVVKGKPRLSENMLWKSGVTVGAAGMPVVRNMAYWMGATAFPYVVMTCGALYAEDKHGGITNQADIDDGQAKQEARMITWYAYCSVFLTLGFFIAYLKYQYDRAYGEEDTPSLDTRQRRAVTSTVQGGLGLVAAVRPLLEMMEEEEKKRGGDATQELLAPDAKAKGSEMLRNVRVLRSEDGGRGDAAAATWIRSRRSRRGRATRIRPRRDGVAAARKIRPRRDGVAAARGS